MTIKGSDIFNKIMGAGLMLGSMAFFSDIGVQHEFLFPGVLFGVAGVFFATRREKRAALQAEEQRRLDQLAEGLAATQQELTAVMERLDRISDERDFMRQLAAPEPTRRVAPEASRAASE